MSDSQDVESFDDLLQRYDGNTSETGEISLYDELSVLYDRFYEQHFNYEALAGLLGSYAEMSEVNSVVEGACGTGRLLSEFKDEGYDLFGFDNSQSMLNIASNNCDATLFKSRLEEFYIPFEVDAFLVLGNALYHLSPEQRRQLFTQAYETMSNQSTFLFSFMDKNKMVDGNSGGEVYTVDDWNIRRNSIFSLLGGDKANTAFSYRVSDVEDDYTRMQVGFSIDGYIHSPKEIETELTNIGFTNITITRPDASEHTVAIARKVA